MESRDNGHLLKLLIADVDTTHCSCSATNEFVDDCPVDVCCDKAAVCTVISFVLLKLVSCDIDNFIGKIITAIWLTNAVFCCYWTCGDIPVETFSQYLSEISGNLTCI